MSSQSPPPRRLRPESWVDPLLFGVVRLRALRSVLTPSDLDFRVRAIYRWYSQTLCTPLHVVEDMPPEEVFRAYWEAAYESMDRDELRDEVRRLTRTRDEELEEEKLEDVEDAADDNFFDQVLAKAKESAQKLEAAIQARPINPAHIQGLGATPTAAAAAPQIKPKIISPTKTVASPARSRPRDAFPEPHLPDASTSDPDAPEDVHIVFGNLDEIEQAADARALQQSSGRPIIRKK